jgi:hypothetical protein
MKTFFLHALFSALLACSSGALAQAPASVQALLQALPELPASAEQAATWVDQAGRLVHPPLLRLQAAIAEHQQAMQRIAAAQGRAHTDQGQVLAHKVAQGLQDVGIDAQRMQTDPAYARQVQERLRRMTPAEQVAMAQRMAQPLNHDPRIINQAAAMAQDTPAARAAAQAGQAYTAQQLQRAERHAALWAETESAVQRVRARQLTVGVPRPDMAWDNLGCDPRCQAQWEAHAAKKLPLMIARESEILALRRAAVQRQRAALAADVATAERHLQATEFGVASTSPIHQGHIVGYDAAVVAEILGLLDRTAQAVKGAAVVPHCGVQVVLVPRAICR